jgi:AmmeMemoRadiSam system protein B/AmmeMemoRadiSam system protein A
MEVREMYATKCLRRLPCLGAIGLSAATAVFAETAEPKVRPAYCAGQWYPDSEAELARQVDDLLARASPPTSGVRPLALIVPHAGYRFSAPVAAEGYRRLQGHRYRRAIVLAFSHSSAGLYNGVDVPEDLTAYRTPLGEVPIDREVCDSLLKSPGFAAHPGIDRGEHSLELQLPFLQRTVREFRLVPLLIGRMSTSDYAAAADAILRWVDEDTLLVASSDFTHFGPQYGYTPFENDAPNKLRELADQAGAPILNCDFDGFLDHLAKTQDTICGRGPIALLLRVLSMYASSVAVRSGSDTSGRMMNDWTNSVTYQSFVFTARTGTLNREDRDRLLPLARLAVMAQLDGKERPRVETDKLPEKLRADGACFVTLENHGRLRGCIGNMVADGPLYQSVIRNAVSACQDYRFREDPVTAAEFDQLDIEISYLTPMKRVQKTEEIIVGRHGLMISLGPRRGVLLPQVAARRGWTRAEFLSQTCRKAGLPPEAWKHPEAEIYSFEAEVFGEPKPTALPASGGK